MRMHKDERGQMLVISALSFALLLAFTGLAVDVGMMFAIKRKAQAAADAAAIAAALEAQNGGSGSCSTEACAAQNAATLNGVPNASSNVTLNTGSNISSSYHNSAGYIQAVVHIPVHTVFMGIFNNSTIPVSASAIAGLVPSKACIYVLDPTDADSLWIKGSSDINTPNCGIQVNSNSSSAFCDQGSASIEAPYIHVVGQQGSGGSCDKSPGSPVSTGVASAGDPLNGMTGPNPSSDCTGSNTVTAATIVAATTIPSSTVTTNGTTASVTCFNVAGGGPTTISGGVKLGTAGGNQIFVFENGVTIGGTVTVNGTIDNYQGTFTQGNSTLNITAPSNKTYTYTGIAIMQPASNTTGGGCSPSAGKGLMPGEPCLQLQFGSGSGNISGLVYAPTSMVYQQDQGGGTAVSNGGIIAYTLFLNASNMDLSDSYNDSNPSTTPLTAVALVE